MSKGGRSQGLQGPKLPSELCCCGNHPVPLPANLTPSPMWLWLFPFGTVSRGPVIQALESLQAQPNPVPLSVLTAPLTLQSPPTLCASWEGLRSSLRRGGHRKVWGRSPRTPNSPCRAPHLPRAHRRRLHPEPPEWLRERPAVRRQETAPGLHPVRRGGQRRHSERFPPGDEHQRPRLRVQVHGPGAREEWQRQPGKSIFTGLGGSQRRPWAPPQLQWAGGHGWRHLQTCVPRGPGRKGQQGQLCPFHRRPPEVGKSGCWCSRGQREQSAEAWDRRAGSACTAWRDRLEADRPLSGPDSMVL